MLKKRHLRYNPWGWYKDSPLRVIALSAVIFCVFLMWGYSSIYSAWKRAIYASVQSSLLKEKAISAGGAKYLFDPSNPRNL
jgi:hypothetical protein